jgi:hypothetical protein
VTPKTVVVRIGDAALLSGSGVAALALVAPARPTPRVLARTKESAVMVCRVMDAL